ncbi:MAG TPA: hypothetical protein VGP28_01265 [Methylocella sp.]|jgi:hypothetical protein|nr:hypothetical protein [Methylocella sp.]
MRRKCRAIDHPRRDRHILGDDAVRRLWKVESDGAREAGINSDNARRADPVKATLGLRRMIGGLILWAVDPATKRRSPSPAVAHCGVSFGAHGSRGLWVFGLAGRGMAAGQEPRFEVVLQYSAPSFGDVNNRRAFALGNQALQ